MSHDTYLIKLPYPLGLMVNEILKEKIHFTPRKSKNGLLSCEFTRDELALIDKLKFDNPGNGSLEGIDLLPNLKSLTIKSVGNSSYSQDKFIASISDKDGSSIAKCKNLEYLEIENQSKLSFIDVSQMKKLHYFSANQNAQLDKIFGLDSIEELWELNCVGNESLTRIEDLNSIIMNNPDLTELNLDVLLYPDAVGYDVKTGSVNEDTIKRFNEINVSWQEILANGKNIKINNYQMMNMHQKAMSALEDYIPKICDSRTIVIGIEQFLAENVTYDNDALKTGHSHSYSSKTDSLPAIITGPIGGANGAYNAFVYNTCVCEGYTRAMQYLLRLKGLKSHNVHCISGADKLHMSTDKGDNRYKTYNLPDDGYHSIISIDDLDYLYDDPCWNAGRYQRGDQSMPWTLLTKEEISRDHTLSFGERNINNNTFNIPRSVIQIAIKRIKSFREEKRKTKINFSEQAIADGTAHIPTTKKDESQSRLANDEKLIPKDKQL